MKTGVCDSLEYVLFHQEPNLEEAMFWAFEYYDSGFQEECITYLTEHCIPRYMSHCDRFLKFVHKKNREWKKTRDPLILATIVKNILSTRRRPTAKRFIRATERDIPSVPDLTGIKPYRTLNILCKYKIHSHTATDKSMVDIFSRDWLYYTKMCPLWNKRVHEYNGTYDDAQKKIVFNGVREEEDEELFYMTYNYEPDEQSIDIFEKCIGIRPFTPFLIS